MHFLLMACLTVGLIAAGCKVDFTFLVVVEEFPPLSPLFSGNVLYPFEASACSKCLLRELPPSNSDLSSSTSTILRSSTSLLILNSFNKIAACLSVDFI